MAALSSPGRGGARASDQEVLGRARELIAAGWCQGQYALDAQGRPARALNVDDAAVAFCPVGAISRALVEAGRSPEDRYVICKKLKPTGIVDFNDKPERTQEEVIALFDEWLG